MADGRSQVMAGGKDFFFSPEEWMWNWCPGCFFFFFFIFLCFFLFFSSFCGASGDLGSFLALLLWAFWGTKMTNFSGVLEGNPKFFGCCFFFLGGVFSGVVGWFPWCLGAPKT